MAEERVSRKLAAILHADVVGYSRLMHRDEQATMQALIGNRAVFAAHISGRGGRIVNAPGDSILAEFGSVVDAVGCALEIQDALSKCNEPLPEERRMNFRIGVNLGDVLVDDSGIYGDGVNVAARLEALADPGGICVSRAVRDQVRGKLGVAFDDMGEHAVKNIARPVRIYRLRRETTAIPSRASASMPPSRPPLSIVVLPFNNLGGDAEQEYLADGITDDLTTDLSRIAGSFVIARNSAFTYKGKPVDIKQLGRELGVAYALEGSVRRAGDRVRVNAQLIDTESGAHVWADRFDRELGDLLALQDDVTGSIARVLRYELVEAESRRSLREHPANPQAIDHLLRAQAIVFRGPMFTRENVRAARPLLEEAVRLDPGLVGALAALSGSWLTEVAFGWTDDVDAALARAEAFLLRAEGIAPSDARVLLTRGVLLVLQRKPGLAFAVLQSALARDPNSTQILINLGWCNLFLGEPETAIAHVERALRLDPRGFNRANMHGILGTAHLYLGGHEQAIRYLKLICDESPRFAFPRFMLAAACALAGRMSDAQASLAEFRRLRPGVGIAQIRAEELSDDPKYRALRERVYEGLRLAGLEE
jgi:TolB-like protein/class 3 adenylate cyclase/Tfp pilus assembly protein PilF